MADERIPDTAEAPREPDAPARRERPLWERIARGAAIGLAGLAALIVAGLLALDTGPGHRFIAGRLGAIDLQSGLNFRVGRIEGSIFGAMVLRDVEIRDTKGTFARAAELDLDWRPFKYLANRIDIRRLASPEVQVLRNPVLESVPANPNAPILPDLNIDIAAIDFTRIDVAPAVTGRRHIASVSGSAHLSDGRVQIDADAGTRAAAGIAGGDRLALKLDAVPDANRLGIDLRLQAPGDGLVAGLAGVDKATTLSIAGKGDWKRWNGEAVGTFGGAELADLAIAANDGTFHVRGTAEPAPLLPEPQAELAKPGLDVAIDAKWRDRTADTNFTIGSDALQVQGRGLVDLGNNRFDGFRVEALVRKPAALAKGLSGKGVHAAAQFDGPFARPLIDYKLAAASIGFGSTQVERLYAEGRANVDAGHILVPVKARAARVSGVDAAGGLLTDLTLDGDVAISGDQLLSDNLHLKSQRIDATALIVADLGAGSYHGALKGRVNDYRIDGIAVVNLTTDAKLVSAKDGGWGLQGQVAGRSSAILNGTLLDLLGGNASATAQVALGPSGDIDFRSLRLDAPEFRVTNGSGRVSAKGTLLFNADATSTRYGPITARVAGTAAAPEVVLKAPRPGLGIGLADLEAHVKAQGGGWAVTAKGGTDYGPFSAVTRIETGKATAVTIDSGRFAGMDVSGRLVATPAGPFDGQVDFSGSGVSGHAFLAAKGKLQHAAIDAHASSAVIPGVAGLTIGRAIAKGEILFADTPQITGDVQVEALRQGNFSLQKARAKIDYHGGSGTAQLLANGSTGVPFTIAANAKLEPALWLVALQGQASRVKFHSQGALRIDVGQADYRLEPGRIAFDSGEALIAGRYGDGLTVQARLQKLDLSVINAIVPGLGIGGSATGAVDFTQANSNAFPRADARLDVKGFTRSGIESVSTPVDVTLVGKLLADGGDARALVKRGSATIGRMVATLRPLGAEAGSWQHRLMAAPLSGGIRYNGPAATIFSLAGLSGQQVSGPIGIAADFSGRVDQPQLTGVVKASNLTYVNESYGTRLTALKIDGQFSNDKLVIANLSATAGSGSVKASGSIGLSSAQNFPLDLTAELNDARLARSDALGATATGKIHITRDAKGGKIEGDLTIPEARYEVIRQGAAEVPELTGIRRKGQALPTPEERATASAGSFDLALRIRADNQLYISGMGLESEWRANLTIGGTSAKPEIGGTATVVRGTYDFAGRRFDISRGTIRFQGSRLSNPSIEISASATAEGITAILNVTGTAERPQIAFSSSPALPQEEVLSRILFGSSVTNLSATEAIQLAAALNSLRGSGGGLNPLGKLRSVTGIDRLRILSADNSSGRGTALAAGKYITNDIYVEVITDARGFTATQLEIALSKALSILSQTSSFGGSSVSIRYSKDY